MSIEIRGIEYVRLSEAEREIKSLRAQLAEERRQHRHWHECFDVLSHALVGETGASAIDVAHKLRAQLAEKERELNLCRDVLAAISEHALDTAKRLGRTGE